MRIGDPLADAVIVDLGGLNQEETGRFFRAAIEQQDNVLRTAPQSLLHFVDEVNTLPVWYDRSVAQHGCRVFLRNSTQFLTAFSAGAIVDGFATMISKSFAAKIRALIDKSEEWEHDAWGVSVNAAHLALATAAFSARLTQVAQMLGAELDNKDDREAFMAVWRYDA